MRVTINHRINSTRVRDYLIRSPTLRRSLLSEMTDENDVVCTGIFRLVNRSLNLCIQAFSALILTESVDVCSTLILEVRWCGLCEALRCTCPHKCHLHCPERKHLIRSKYRLSGSQIHEVTRVISAVQLFCKLEKTVHSVIELMVSGNCKIIPDLIHDVDQITAFRQRADRRSLNRISGIRQNHIRSLRLHLFLVESKTCVTDVVIHTTVDIVRVQNNDVLVPCKCRKRHAGRQTQHHRQTQDPAEQFLETFLCHTSSSSFLRASPSPSDQLQNRLSVTLVTLNFKVFP